MGDKRTHVNSSVKAKKKKNLEKPLMLELMDSRVDMPPVMTIRLKELSPPLLQNAFEHGGLPWKGIAYIDHWKHRKDCRNPLVSGRNLKDRVLSPQMHKNLLRKMGSLLGEETKSAQKDITALFVGGEPQKEL